MNTNELFNDEIFNIDENTAIEVADKIYKQTPEEVIKEFVNNLIKENNLDGFIQDRGVNCTSEYVEIFLNTCSFKCYYNEIKTISLKNQTMVLTYKQVNNPHPDGFRNYGDMAINFVINKKSNKLYVRQRKYTWNFKPSDDYEVYDFK